MSKQKSVLDLFAEQHSVQLTKKKSSKERKSGQSEPDSPWLLDSATRGIRRRATTGRKGQEDDEDSSYFFSASIHMHIFIPYSVGEERKAATMAKKLVRKYAHRFSIDPEDAKFVSSVETGDIIGSDGTEWPA